MFGRPGFGMPCAVINSFLCSEAVFAFGPSVLGNKTKTPTQTRGNTDIDPATVPGTSRITVRVSTLAAAPADNWHAKCVGPAHERLSGWLGRTPFRAGANLRT